MDYYYRLPLDSMAMSYNELKREYEFPVKWTIPDFLSLDLTTEKDLKSPIFSTDDETEWQIKIDTDDEPELYLQLHIIRSHSCHVSTVVNFGIMNADGLCTCPKTPTARTFSVPFTPSHSYIFPFQSSEFINRDILSENSNYLLPNGHLTVVCQVILEPSKKHSFRFVEDMFKLLNDAEFSDVILSARGEEFFAHKSILAGRSPVFREMLRNHDGSSVINVDIDARIFERLLEFIYTGCAHFISRNSAKDLIIVAKKYKIDDLENVCIEYLCKKVSIDNALELIMFAIRNEFHVLKSKALERLATKLVKGDAISIMNRLFHV